MFENNTDKDKNIEGKLSSLSLKDNINNMYKDINTANSTTSTSAQIKLDEIIVTEHDSKSVTEVDNLNKDSDSSLYKDIPEPVYKSNLNKFNFLQTQLSGDTLNLESTLDDLDVVSKHDKEHSNVDEITNDNKDNSKGVLRDESNITDDIRIAKTHIPSKVDNSSSLDTESCQNEAEISISVPPRKKKLQSLDKLSTNTNKLEVSVKSDKEYPDDLNPFLDDDGEVNI